MYLSLPLALERAKERCQRVDDDTLDGYLTELLEISKGSEAPTVVGGVGQVHYRPFWVAARAIAQDPNIRDLSEAVGEAKFTLADPRIADLLATQAAYDFAFDLKLPPGMAAKPNLGTPIWATTSIPMEAVL